MKLFSVFFFSGVICLFRIPNGLCADIIGGIESRPHSRPYMALIKGMKAICGGSLIKPNWVLTAAHCDLGKNVTVILGAHSSDKTEKTQQKFGIHKFVPYPHYNKDKKQSDIMLLQLKGRATISKYVKTIDLGNSYEDIKAGTLCLVAGWGITKNRMKTPSATLREVNVTVIERRVCQQQYSSLVVVTLNMVCAGDKNGGKDACFGDSGGPLVCKGKQRGIVSFSVECGDPRFPGVYTLLTKAYSKWIKKTIGGNIN